MDTGGGDTHRFVRDEGATTPHLLATLASLRKAAKRDMARARQDGRRDAAALADNRQKAMKVCMNSYAPSH